MADRETEVRLALPEWVKGRMIRVFAQEAGREVENQERALFAVREMLHERSGRLAAG